MSVGYKSAVQENPLFHGRTDIHDEQAQRSFSGSGTSAWTK